MREADTAAAAAGDADAEDERWRHVTIRHQSRDLSADCQAAFGAHLSNTATHADRTLIDDNQLNESWTSQTARKCQAASVSM